MKKILLIPFLLIAFMFAILYAFVTDNTKELA
jgi:hypothetical protein